MMQDIAGSGRAQACEAMRRNGDRNKSVFDKALGNTQVSALLAHRPRNQTRSVHTRNFLLTPSLVTNLQRSIGNRAVGLVIERVVRTSSGQTHVADPGLQQSGRAVLAGSTHRNLDTASSPVGAILTLPCAVGNAAVASLHVQRSPASELIRKHSKPWRYGQPQKVLRVGSLASDLRRRLLLQAPLVVEVFLTLSSDMRDNVAFDLLRGASDAQIRRWGADDNAAGRRALAVMLGEMSSGQTTGRFLGGGERGQQDRVMRLITRGDKDSGAGTSPRQTPAARALIRAYTTQYRTRWDDSYQILRDKALAGNLVTPPAGPEPVRPAGVRGTAF